MTGLAGVLSEIAELLLADDWCKYLSSDERSYYYVIGSNAFDAEPTGRWEWTRVEIPGLKQSGPQAESHVRSQLAADQPDYLATARRRLTSVGITDDQVDSFISALSGADEDDLFS